MNTAKAYCGHSADVRMQLLLNGTVLPIAQLGPDFLILDKPVDHSPADGEIVLSVDGRERRWPVRLPAGISSAASRIPISI
jgi:hypothetical protein